MSNSEFLHSLIHAKYNTTHFHDEFKEKAYFCGDCGGNSLTQNEKETEHVGHNVIRAMKNSNHYCYKKNDILSLNNKIDVSGVCCYIINSFDVYFPKSRVKFHGESGGNIGKQGHCVTCGWLIAKHTQALYCSILCKLQYSGDFERLNKLIMEKPQVDVGTPPLIKKNKKGSRSSSKKRKRGIGGSKKFGGKSNSGVCKKVGGKSSKSGVCLKIKFGGKTVTLGKKLDDLVEDAIKILSYRKRSRKGVPRRAPFY